MKALVLSGGSAKIGFQLGVYDSLEDKKFDAFFGVSCGAIFSAMLAQDNYTLTKELILNLENKHIYKGSLSKLSIIYRIITGKNNLINMNPLRGMLVKYVKKENFKFPAYFSYVDLNTGEFKTVCSDNLETSEQIIDAIMASASIPVIMPTVKIDGLLNVDGGLIKTCPLSEAVKINPDEIVVINCFNREKHSISKTDNIINIALHCINNIMLEEMSKQSVNAFVLINALIYKIGKNAELTRNNKAKTYKYIPIRIYEPDIDVELGDGFDFSKASMLDRFNKGVLTKFKTN